MHENGLATDSGAACISSEAEDDDTLDIEVEDTPVGHYHDPNTHDGMTREQYGAQIAERLGNLVRTLKEYTPTFIQNEIPKLIKKREERIETKPPAWPVSAISALGAHEVRGEWLEPVEGTEPIEYETGGQVTIDGMVY